MLVACQLAFVEPKNAAVGGALMALGEAIRLASVACIGSKSRTRGSEVGPLVTWGPYRVCRNPIYVGNAFLWAGFGVWGGWAAVSLL